MILHLDLGTAWRIVKWNNQLLDFPKIIKFKDKNYEWVMYEEGKSIGDYILHFAEIKNYNSLDSIVNLDDIENGNVNCQCGSKHTSFSQIHMLYCPLWRKIP